MKVNWCGVGRRPDWSLLVANALLPIISSAHPKWSHPTPACQRTITQKFHFQTTENAKNSRSSRVLTQGDKLNLIKARKFQQASKNNLVEGSGENQESKIQGLDSSTPAKTKSKTSTDGKTSKLNSLRTAKPNILPKREGSRTNSRLVLLEEVAAQIWFF